MQSALRVMIQEKKCTFIVVCLSSLEIRIAFHGLAKLDEIVRISPSDHAHWLYKSIRKIIGESPCI